MDDSPRILLTGVNGFLGWNLGTALRAAGWHVTGVVREAPRDVSAADAWITCDLGHGAPASPASARIDAVVHCAAMASVAACENDRAGARRVNVDATARLAALAAERGAAFVYISTDLVFDGTRGGYSEADLPNPVTFYAETKLRGEAEAARCARHYIIRTALMYGRHGADTGSFLRWTLDALREHRRLTLYTNQFRNPLFAPDVAVIVQQMLQRRSVWSDLPPGVYHAGGPERLSRHDIGMRIAHQFDLDKSYIEGLLLKRVSVPGDFDDTTLVTEKLRAAMSVRFTSLDDGLRMIRIAPAFSASPHSG